MVPLWKGAFENWSRKFVSENKWRITYQVGDSDDALQQCAVVFVRICNRYGETTDNPAWLMSLYKSAVFHHFHTQARKDGNSRSILSTPPDDYEISEASCYPDARLVAIWLDASEELRVFLRTMAGATPELLAILFRETESTREVLNRRWRRICKLETEADLVGELHALLTT